MFSLRRQVLLRNKKDLKTFFDHFRAQRAETFHHCGRFRST
jgi:hypothetical protein